MEQFTSPFFEAPEEAKVIDRVLLAAERARQARGKTPLECVVVESDWDCYDAVWKLVELEHDRNELLARVDATPGGEGGS